MCFWSNCIVSLWTTSPICGMAKMRVIKPRDWWTEREIWRRLLSKMQQEQMKLISRSWVFSPISGCFAAGASDAILVCDVLLSSQMRSSFVKNLSVGLRILSNPMTTLLRLPIYDSFLTEISSRQFYSPYLMTVSQIVYNTLQLNQWLPAYWAQWKNLGLHHAGDVYVHLEKLLPSRFCELLLLVCQNGDFWFSKLLIQTLCRWDSKIRAKVEESKVKNVKTKEIQNSNKKTRRML